MILTLVGKLSVEDKNIMLETFRRVNDASNWLSQKVFELKTANPTKVHHHAYHELRTRFALPAAYACAIIRRVCNAYKTRTKKLRFKQVIGFKKFAAIDLNQFLFDFRDNCQCVSLKLATGERIKFPITFGRNLGSKVKFVRKSAKLVYRKSDGEFYLHVPAEFPEEEPITLNGWLGVDVGIKNVAVDSLGNFYGGEELTEKRLHYKEKRRELQRKEALKRKLGKDNRSVRRALLRISKKERRFARDVLHCVSKRIVADAKALALGIALENLKGARARITTKVRRQERYIHSCWSYFTLQQYITYKAKLHGVPVIFVDAQNTSRTCPACGFVSKKNRQSQEVFRCGKCGYVGNADLVAARNIALWAQGINPCPQMPEGFNPLLGQGCH